MRLSTSEQARYLATMKDALEQFISPELTSQKAKNVAKLLSDLLAQMALETSQGEQLSRDYIHSIEPAVAQATKVLDVEQANFPPNAVLSDWREFIASLAPGLYQKGAKGRQWLLTLLQAELVYQQKIADTHVANQCNSNGQPIESRLDERLAITAYLRRRYPHLPNIQVLNITPLAGGRSKQTIVLQLAHFGEELAAEVVMRRDLTTSLVSGSAADEYALIKTVFDAGGVPVPKPYLCEKDAALLGGSFILLEKVAGESIADFYPEVEVASGDLAAIGKQEAKALARLHNLDIGLFNHTIIDTNPDIRVQLNTLIDEIEARAKAGVESHQSITLTVACSWLRDHMDYGLIGPVALLHGDMGLHNQLIEDNIITGLIDWELSCVGPVAKELGACRIALKQLLPWQEFVNYYQQYGGSTEACDPKAIAFYYLLTAATGVSYTKLARHYFCVGASDDITLGHAGYLCGHFGERALAEALLEALQLD